MKIGISTSVMQRGRSGVGQYILALIHALLEEAGDHQLVLFVLKEDLPLFAFAAVSAAIVPVSEFFRPPVANILWHQTRLPQLASVYKLDVLHIPSYRRLLWKGPCPLVATIHDLAPFRISKKYDFLRMLYARFVVPLLARRQQKIIAVSEFTATDITSFFGLPREQTKVIYNGLDHKRFCLGSQEQAVADAARLYDLHKPFFLYVARLEHPAKNHVRLINAFSGFKATTHSQWELVLCGGDWHGAAVVHKAIQRSDFSDDIRVLGFVADENLPILYRTAGLFVFPSLFEGFGLPVIEAMACGCPVLASTRGALEEVLGGASAVVDAESTLDIQERLAQLAGDHSVRKSLRSRGLARAVGFNWRRTAIETLDTYFEAASHRIGGACRSKERRQGNLVDARIASLLPSDR